MRIAGALAATAFGLQSTAALACMAEPVPEALVYEQAPDEIPANAVLLSVRDVRVEERSYFFTAEVLEGPQSIRGKRVWIGPEVESSCLTIGRQSGFVVVYRQPVREGRRIFLEAVAYTRSWWDWIPALLGSGPYVYPSGPADNSWARSLSDDR